MTQEDINEIATDFIHELDKGTATLNEIQARCVLPGGADVLAKIDEILRKWEVKGSEAFVADVTQIRDHLISVQRYAIENETSLDWIAFRTESIAKLEKIDVAKLSALCKLASFLIDDCIDEEVINAVINSVKACLGLAEPDPKYFTPEA